MRRTLGTLTAAAATCVFVTLTAGCGSSASTNGQGGPAYDPAGSPSGRSGVISGAQVRLISMTGVGGRVRQTAAALDTRADVAAFARQFPAPAVGQRIRAAVQAARGVPGDRMVGQVIAVGCDRPPGADAVQDRNGDVHLVAHEVASPLEECLVPVTTVAIAVLPAR